MRACFAILVAAAVAGCDRGEPPTSRPGPRRHVLARPKRMPPRTTTVAKRQADRVAELRASESPGIRSIGSREVLRLAMFELYEASQARVDCHPSLDTLLRDVREASLDLEKFQFDTGGFRQLVDTRAVELDATGIARLERFAARLRSARRDHPELLLRAPAAMTTASIDAISDSALGMSVALKQQDRFGLRKSVVRFHASVAFLKNAVQTATRGCAPPPEREDPNP